MDDNEIAILRACRRSRIKARVYKALFGMKIGLAAELAEAAATTVDRVLLVMHGDDELYRKDTSLVRLGVARPRRTSQGLVFAITTTGAAAWRTVEPRLKARRSIGTQVDRT